MESILTCIKQMLGIEENDEAFDKELIIHINSAISVLTQLGVGLVDGFKITGKLEEWIQLTLGRIDIDDIKNYIYFKCRLSFDPPQNSFLVKSLEDQIKELEWRIDVQVDPVE